MINIPDKNGRTALHFAVMGEDKEIIQSLINSGADINAKTNGGERPIHKASALGNVEIT